MSELSQSHKITISAAKIEAARKAQIQTIAPKVNLKGFRPGKAPLEAIERQYGDSVMQDVLDKVINDGIQTLLADKKVKLAGRPEVKIEKFEAGNDLDMEVTFEVLPTVKPFDVKSIKLERLTADVLDADIEESIGFLAKQLRTSEVKGGPAAIGDSVKIDFKGWLNDVARDDMAGRDADLELGSNSFIPGFEDRLVGAKAGETVNFDITFPATYHNADFQNQPAKFEVLVKSVAQMKNAEMNDAMAQKLGQASLEAVRNKISDNIKAEYAEQSRLKLKKVLFDQIETAHPFELPAGMVEQEYKMICEQVEHERHGHAHGHDHDDHDHAHHTHIAPEEHDELKKIAARRVRVGLVLAEIGQANNVQVSDDDIRAAIMHRANQYPGMQQRVIEQFKKNPQMIENLKPSIFEDKVVDFILELATIADKRVSKDDLMADID